MIQVREKDLSARELRDFVAATLEVARPHGAKVLVNDRLDVALAAGADGVHLRVDSLPASEVRAIARKQSSTPFLIGASTHSLAEAKQAEADGADFIVFGPIYDTPSKREFGPPLGPKALIEVCNALRIPALALGGITINNANEILRAGARGIAAIGLFTQPNVEEVVRELLHKRDESRI